MSREMRRNVIVSHGGKHGAAKGTYLKGSSPSTAAAALMPGDLVATTKTQPVAPAPKPKPAPGPKTELGYKPTPRAVAAAARPPLLPQVPESKEPRPKNARALKRMGWRRVERLALQEGVAFEAGADKAVVVKALIEKLDLK